MPESRPRNNSCLTALAKASNIIFNRSVVSSPQDPVLRGDELPHWTLHRLRKKCVFLYALPSFSNALSTCKQDGPRGKETDKQLSLLLCQLLCLPFSSSVTEPHLRHTQPLTPEGTTRQCTETHPCYSLLSPSAVLSSCGVCQSRTETSNQHFKYRVPV
ncbi:hypothetical protein STEG23_026574 [Scotinomys teguina]